PDAGAGLGEASIVLAPQLAPAGIDDDGVGGPQLDVLLLQRAFEVLDGDLVAVAEHLDALVAGDVDQHAAREQRPDILDAERAEAGAGRDLVGLEAVVVTVAVALVGEAVELGADLPDLRQHHLLVAAAVV